MATDASLLPLSRIEADYEVSPKKIRKAVKDGALKGTPMGRALYVERTDLEAWIRHEAEINPPKKRQGAVG